MVLQYNPEQYATYTSHLPLAQSRLFRLRPEAQRSASPLLRGATGAAGAVGGYLLNLVYLAGIGNEQQQ